MATVADLVIEDLAKEVMDGEATAIRLLTEAASYRHLACAALDRLAELTKEMDALQRRLLDQQQQIKALMGLTDDAQRQGEHEQE